MSSLIWSAHSKSTISSWVNTEYADPPPLHISSTSSSESMRIETVRQLIASGFLKPGPASTFDLSCIRSLRTNFRILSLKVPLRQHPSRLRLADVNIGERL